MRESTKARIAEAVDGRRDRLIALARSILAEPELGYREFETAARVQRTLDELGVPHRDGLAVTGVKAVLDTGRPGPTVAILGELDSIGAAGHPHARAETGAAHACGHHCQIAMMLGAGMALLDSGALAELAGRVALVAVPAEEYVEIGYRLGLRREGRIEFLVGKAELIRLGELDDVDFAMMIHAGSNPDYRKLAVGGSTNGMVAKSIRYVGRAAHAGSAPHRGVNALGAAHVALAAIHAQRETFRDEDHVRVHPIITRGGELVSVVPAEARMETFVRASGTDALADADKKVDRALRAGAQALGATLEVTTLPGYLPLRNDPLLADLFRANAEAVVGADSVGRAGHVSGGTDMGDLSQLIPAIHPFSGGAVGTAHGADFLIEDYNVAVVAPAKALALTAADLLARDAAEARRLIAAHRPAMTRAAYLAYARGLMREERYRAED